MQSADGGCMNKEEYQEERQKILDGYRNREYISTEAIRKITRTGARIFKQQRKEAKS